MWRAVSVAAAAVGLALSPAAQAAQTAGCSAAKLPGLGAVKTGAVKRTLDVPKPITIHLGSADKTKKRTIVFGASPSLPPNRRLTAVVQGDLTRSDGEALSVDQVTAFARTNAVGDVRLRICVKAAAVSPGTYSGTITVVGQGVERAAVGLQVTRRQTPRSAILWIALGGLIGLVSGYVYGGIQFKTPQGTADHIKYWAGIALPVALGVLGASLVYWQIYLTNQSWGQDSGDGPKVFVAALIGASGGIGISGLAGIRQWSGAFQR